MQLICYWWLVHSVVWAECCSIAVPWISLRFHCLSIICRIIARLFVWNFVVQTLNVFIMLRIFSWSRHNTCMTWHLTLRRNYHRNILWRYQNRLSFWTCQKQLIRRLSSLISYINIFHNIRLHVKTWGRNRYKSDLFAIQCQGRWYW